MEKIYVAFHKPFGVLSQFTGEANQLTLASFNLPAGVYAAGRLDKDSEGLLILTNDGPFIKKVSDPRSNKEKTYWVQVEGVPAEGDLSKLRLGTVIKGHKCLPCQATLLTEFELPPREPPIRERINIPTSWIEVRLVEGKNRQVRRMCAAIGFPCLRLIRSKVGKLSIKSLPVGEWAYVTKEQIL
jgi:23S rRNA pseudouridine2457 synthase